MIGIYSRISFIAVLIALLLGNLSAKEKKPEPANKPPQIIMIVPLGIARGPVANLVIRGIALDTATEIHATVARAEVPAKIKSKGKAELPKDAPPEKLGDTQVEIELKVPAEMTAVEAAITVTTPNGTSAPQSLRLFAAADLTIEKEPNAHLPKRGKSPPRLRSRAQSRRKMTLTSSGLPERRDRRYPPRYSPHGLARRSIRC